MPDLRDGWRLVPCAPARSPRPAGAIRCRRQQQIERRAGGGWLNIGAAADDCRAMLHARDAAARAFAAESCGVVAHLDVDVLAGFIQSGLDGYAGRAGVLHDVGEGLLQDAQNMEDILRRQARKPWHLPHLPVEIDALLAQAVVEPVAQVSHDREEIIFGRLQRVDGKPEITPMPSCMSCMMRERSSTMACRRSIACMRW